MPIFSQPGGEVRFQEEGPRLVPAREHPIEISPFAGAIQAAEYAPIKRVFELYAGVFTDSVTWDAVAYSSDLARYVAIATNSSDKTNWSNDGVTWSKLRPLTIEFDSAVGVMLDPNKKSSHIILSNGNRTATGDGSSSNRFSVQATSFKSTGKWYYEFHVDSGYYFVVGIAKSTMVVTDSTMVGNPAGNGIGYLEDGRLFNEGSGGAWGATYTVGNIISVLFDADAGTLIFWKNGVSQGTAATGLSGSYAPAITIFAAGYATCNFGATAFAYSLPEGYLAWEQVHAGGSPYNTITNSNYTITGNNGSNWAATKILQVGSGTFDFKISAANLCHIGICSITDDIVAAENAVVGLNAFISTGYSYYGPTGNKYHNGSGSAYGATFGTGDAITVLYNEGLGTLSFRKNGVDQGLAFSGIVGSNVVVVSLIAAATVNSNVIFLPSAGYWSSIVWAPELSLFCTVSQTGQKCALSSDGYVWTQYSMPYAGGANWMSVAWNGTTFVSVDYLATNQCCTSTDGQTWVLHNTMPTACQWVKILWAPELNKFCAISTTANVAVSSDGETWTPGTIAAGKYGIAWSGSLFMAVDGTGSVETSPDGINWTVKTSHGVSNGYEVVWTGYEFIVVGLASAKRSTDGTDWIAISSLPTPGGTSFYGIGRGAGTSVVAVGNNSSSLLIVE